MVFGTCSVWLAWTVLTFFLYFFEGSVGVGFVALHGIMDSCSFALATSLAPSLSPCFSVEREMGGRPDGWTAWFEAAKCVAVLICLMSGLGCFCSLVCLGAEKIKRVEGLGLGLGLGSK